MAAPPTIDGTIAPEEWQSAAKTEGLLDMDTASQAPDQGEFWLGYDQTYIYVAARFADPSPGSIRAVEYRTNVGLSGDDHFRFRIDPTGTLEEYNEFFMNANGGSAIQISGGRAVKREWLGEFFTRGRITETGWEVEARIPWKLMAMPGPGKRDMKVNFIRYTSRTQRQSTWAHNGGMRAYHGWWRQVEAPRLPFERSLKLLPFAFGGAGEGESFDVIGGLDFKTQLKPNVQVVGTVSPDFRNIEGDILSLDLSYFERLPRDTRPFFQEGGDYLGSVIFASQRIQRFDTGLNIYGKLNERMVFGLLNTADFGNEINSVGSFTYRVNDNSQLRGGFTNTSGDERPDNSAGFLRYFQNQGPMTYSFRYSASDDEAEGFGQLMDTSVSYTKNGIEGSISASAVSPEFRPRLGFVRDRDFRSLSANVEIERPVPSGSLMEWGVEFGGDSAIRYDRDDFYRDSAWGNVSLTFRNGLDFDFGLERSKFLGNKDESHWISLELPRGDPYRRWQIDFSEGRFDNEDYQSFGLTVLYRPIKTMQTSLRYQRLETSDISEQLIASANLDLGNDFFVSGRLVSRDDDVSGYLSFRRSGNRGNEYYLIIGDPNSRKFESSVILKVVVPFELRF